MRPLQARLDLDALRHNLSVVRRYCPQQRVMAAIKANGYGHGLVRVAETLTRAGCDALGVASIDEALVLRSAGIETTIVLLEGFFSADELPLVDQHRLTLVVHHPTQVEILRATRLQRPLPIWLKFDSGMHRLGLSAEQLLLAWQQLASDSSSYHLLGLLSHLACADEPDNPLTLQQIAALHRVAAGLPAALSLANSAGVIAWPASHGDWVRPGIMLYGISPFEGRRGSDHDLRPVMSLHSHLIAVKQLQAGDTIGYGAVWRCPEAMKVGVVAVGYGDGYPRHLPSGSPVLVNGRRTALLGRVSMDMICVDLRSQPQARCGDPVVLWGDGLPVEEVAQAAGTIAYELTCRLAPRVSVEVHGLG